MSNTLKMNTVVPAPATEDTQPDLQVDTPPEVAPAPMLEAAPSEKPASALAEVRQFIAMLRQERKARARARLLKRTGWAVGGAVFAAFLLARFSGSSPAPAPTGTAPAAGLAGTGSAVALATGEPGPGPVAPSRPSSEPSSELPSGPPSKPRWLGPGARNLGGVVPLDAGASDGLDPAARCEQSFSQQRWRAAVESCTGVFDEAPAAALALRIAHAQWARGQASEARLWAHKALGLGTRDADAFVLIGHAERQAGREHKAAAAYRRYLRASPHGWYARSLRTALRELKPKTIFRQGAVRRNGHRAVSARRVASPGR
jgi:hypothetical protein